MASENNVQIRTPPSPPPLRGGGEGDGDDDEVAEMGQHSSAAAVRAAASTASTIEQSIWRPLELFSATPSTWRPVAVRRAVSVLTNHSRAGHVALVDPFCNCINLKGRSYTSCNCGEEDTVFEWSWDSLSKSTAAQLSNDDREVKFHLEYSCGTAAVRGDQPMKNGQYYWEIKMTSPVYGTDMMVGVGTLAANLNTCRYTFCSLLGSDGESWGLSYTGTVHHQGFVNRYAPKFGQGSIIGLHLDTWNGTLTFFRNRQPLGVAFKNLQGKTLYPMVSSTAARSGMKVIKNRSFKSSLQYLCVQSLRKLVPPNQSLIETFNLPPGLRTFLQNNMDWLVCSTMPPPASQAGTLKPSRKRQHPGSDEEENSSSLKPRCHLQ